ncbi:MAG: sigma-70 family RNA polymerase sigma factor [Azospirillaceae bacterium]
MARADLYAQIEDLIPQLMAHARRITRNGDGAEDLVQTSLERGLRCLDQFRPGTNLRAWLFTILRNTHINEIRRAQRWQGSVDAGDCEHLFPVKANQDAHIELAELACALERLSDSDRRVLVMVGGRGLSYFEASAELDVAVGTVRSRLSRARAKLSVIMDSDRRLAA